MNSAMPWNINGVGFDARESARDAARRQGKSLGEWLHGVIADHADEHGLAPREIGGQDRIDAVTARLEQMGARADHGRRSGRRPDARTDGRGESRATPRRTFEPRDEDDQHAYETPARGRRHEREDEDDLLDQAVASMERRASRAERRTDQALASMTRLLEETQARREQEYDHVAALTRKLGELETNLSARFAEANPLKGSLARLEARLDAIGRRGAAEDGARRSAERPQAEPDEAPIRRLEDKLNTILEAVAAPRRAPAAEASAAAMAAVRATAPAARRSLGDAIADISRRQRALDDESTGGEPALAALKGDVAGLIAKVEDARRDARREPQVHQVHQGRRDGEIEAMRGEIAAMARMLGDLAPRGSIEALEASVGSLAERIDASRDGGIRESVLRPVEAAMNDLRRSLHAIDPRETIGAMEEELRRIGDKVQRLEGGDGAGIERLEGRVADLAERIDRRLAEPRDEAAARLHGKTIEQRLDMLAARLDAALTADRPAPATDTGRLEALVTGLGERLEAAQAPGADTTALDALQRQVEDLARRLERSEGELPGLGASMRDLFAQMDATRTSIESTASHAAREVLKIAAGDGRRAVNAAPEPTPTARDTTLDTMQDMLGKVVDRLAGMEREIADRRSAPAAPEAARAPVAAARPKPSTARPVIGSPDMRLGAAEPRVEPRMVPGARSRQQTEPRQPAAARQPEASRAPVAAPQAELRVPAEDGRRSDFIAAARRAAATAQAEAAAAQRPSEGTARAGLLARSRDYVATNRRPMLMGLAAVLMAIGTLALVGRTNLLDSGMRIASNLSAPAKVALAVPTLPMAAPAAPIDGRVAAQSPSPTLGNPIAGSDPIQTGSIPRLPAFAAAAPPPRPPLPLGLVAAAEGGDAGAQYLLGTQYADGRTLPRDPRAAIGWFEKAAAAGSAPAQYRLGLIFEKGLGAPADKARAKALYIKAAEAGNPRAMHNLAVILADGDGHPDYAGAVSWFRKAAQFGVHDSQYNLGVLLGRGLGAPQNLTLSYQWFAVAAAANDVDAGKKRDEVGLKLTANDLAVAKALAASFQPKAPDAAAVEVVTPPGGWDGAAGASRLNSAKSKISSL